MDAGHAAGPLRVITPDAAICQQDSTTPAGLPDGHTYLFWDDPTHAAQFCRYDITQDLAQVPAGRWYVAMTLLEPPGKYGADGVLQQLDGTPYPYWRWSKHTSDPFSVGASLPPPANVRILRAD